MTNRVDYKRDPMADVWDMLARLKETVDKLAADVEEIRLREFVDATAREDITSLTSRVAVLESAASGYETAAHAAATYLTIANAASTYLTQLNAASTYLTIANAASTYATLSHNHDGTYSASSHNHDGTYSASSHNHSGVYASASHDSAHFGTNDSRYVLSSDYDLHSHLEHDGFYTGGPT